MLRKVPPACAKPRLGGTKAGPKKHAEEPRLRAATCFDVQPRALARGGFTVMVFKILILYGNLNR
jgi:hypothetical protein